ncbi:SGNH/GDSL hydrolase family protein [Lentzea sp. NPDC051838]|uniref:SGNH/GDSL hydrolase family protein n=1 Tax=Lentzea sp. NPDC051838 TaxID=3154849 RepID=UPI003427DB45
MRLSAKIKVALAITVGLVVTTAVDANAAPSFQRYVALGDSYTAGPLIPWQQASWCFRSNNNYPSWLATHLGLYSKPGGFTDVSCSSADTTNMTQSQTTPSTDIPLTSQPPQFEALRLDTDLITIGIGGNDFSVFGSLISTCPEVRSSDPAGHPCQDHYTINGIDTVKAAIKQTQLNLENVIKGARTRSPAAKIVIVGYPRLVPPSGYCPDVVPFADGDYAWTDSVARALNDAQATAARRQNATFVDAYAASLGHDACTGSAAWVSGQSTNLFRAVAYHPYQQGMEGVANLVYRALGGRTPATVAPLARDAATKAQLEQMADIVPKTLNH